MWSSPPPSCQPHTKCSEPPAARGCESGVTGRRWEEGHPIIGGVPWDRTEDEEHASAAADGWCSQENEVVRTETRNPACAGAPAVCLIFDLSLRLTNRHCERALPQGLCLALQKQQLLPQTNVSRSAGDTHPTRDTHGSEVVTHSNVVTVVTYTELCGSTAGGGAGAVGPERPGAASLGAWEAPEGQGFPAGAGRVWASAGETALAGNTGGAHPCRGWAGHSGLAGLCARSLPGLNCHLEQLFSAVTEFELGVPFRRVGSDWVLSQN